VEIEDKGGFLSCLKSGFIQAKLSASGKKREIDTASRKTILLGTNQYPNSLEKISDSADFNKILNVKTGNKDSDVKPIHPFRGSLQYDMIRIAVDRASRRPVVFLFPIGNPAMRKARAQFSSNFFGCAGYQIIDNQGFETIAEGVSEALKSKADIVVICSSDEEYMSYAPEIYESLKEKAIIVVAGNPASIEELKLKGLENFIHMRSNVIEILTEFNNKLGIRI